jgi:ribonuclease BN (tRNA processing enzyme)
MRFTILGTSGAWPEKGRASSGYLLESGGQRVVLDLGYGTLPRLLAHCTAEEVTAVFVTHAHADHCVDLHGLYRARTLPDPPHLPLPIYALPEVMDRIGGLEGPDGSARIRRASDFHAIGPDETIEVGPFRVRTYSLPHFLTNLGFRVEVEGRAIAYTGDTGPSPRVAELAHDADLFVCEATYVGALREGRDGQFLLRATDAGRYARESGAQRLLLTHFWPGTDRAVARSEAAREFQGEILVADEDLSLTVA